VAGKSVGFSRSVPVRTIATRVILTANGSAKRS
jgi:hypothetical protein